MTTELCGAWMPRKKTYCARTNGHSGRCKDAEGLKRERESESTKKRTASRTAKQSEARRASRELEIAAARPEIERLQGLGLCGEWMFKAKTPCARVKGHRGKHLTADGDERRKARLLKENTPKEVYERKKTAARIRQRERRSDPETREIINARKRVDNMTPEKRDRFLAGRRSYRARNRDRINAAKRVENMTPEQHLRQLEQQRERATICRTCAAPGCSRPTKQWSSGTYSDYCGRHMDLVESKSTVNKADKRLAELLECA